ncbi:M23 family metallopeptidase [Clostridium ganghwense]|uniref:M23 family metallopeptidase n=1 Tax=Clostridium ganghwense TaxID=312089 RepID=A0ABT4CL93_9CLOT|nr:M23 family metallopeptidase [Clostridium ganghwense]MCY6369810.1 M23 family metallopeptidase [Clostridium ganghwense]
MENKDNNKKSSFFEKEGFYVVLFVCLCIVAVVAALTTKNNKKAMNKPQTSQVQKADIKDENDIAKALKEESKKEIYNNAMQVKNETKSKTISRNTAIEPVTNGSKGVAVSKTKTPKFVKPVEGKVVMKYSVTPVHWDTSGTDRPHFGINVKAKVGTPVKAVADGEVKSVENGAFGITVVMYHPEYGMRTVYANLDKNIKVKKGDKVTQGKEIGKIGTTTVRGSNEKYGKEFLHFEVLKGSKGEAQATSENPGKYIKY